MGQFFSSYVLVRSEDTTSTYWKSFLALFEAKKMRVLFLGLDDAGKTTLLDQVHSIATGNPMTEGETVPTIGFNTKTIHVGGLVVEAWDLGGQAIIRPMWRCYFSESAAIVFVVDACDRERMHVASKELHALLCEPELAGVPLLVVCNKMDLCIASPVEEVARLVDLETIQDRIWTIQEVSALTGRGVRETMDTLVRLLHR